MIRPARAIVAVVLAAIVMAPRPSRSAEIPPAAQREVDFVKDVVPILQASCVTCHSSGKTEADLSIETREKLLEGGASSPAIVPGNGAESLLVQLVSGMDDERIMPKKGKRLTAEQIGILRAWIDQGAKWPDQFVVADPSKPTPAKLEPREVAIPAPHDGLTNPIDLLLEPYFAQHKITPGKVVDDRVFARRVYLDIVGLLPPPAELEAFVADQSTDKRERLVRKLLADKDAYATHWLSFWNDLLRNDYKGTGYVDGGRKQITPWLYNALVENVPYDVFLRELVTGANGSDGFVKGIVWRGVVNAAQTPQMQAAQNISQVFMGVNLKCASCHDSFINEWKLTDSYGLAGVYADDALEMERCTKPLGATAPIKFLYPQLGAIDPKLPRQRRIDQLAQIITSKENGRLSRTIVNRMWQKMMGRAFIEPVDEMDNKPWNADLLDALSVDFAKHYDLKKLIETIALSRAYQLPSVPGSEGQKEYVFAGPSIKRMTAEQFADAVSTVSGAPLAERPAAALSDVMMTYKNARWIWSDAKAATAAAPGTVYLRKLIKVQSHLETARTLIAADNTFKLLVNGKEVAAGTDGWVTPTSVDLKPHLREGDNVLCAVVENTSDRPNPAGFFFFLELLHTPSGVVKRRQVVQSDKTWTWTDATPPAQWTEASFNGHWKKAAEVGNVASAPWELVSRLPGNVNEVARVRASLCFADPLTVALGRPNREQVNTVRAAEATTLQALELTNGSTLATLLGKGAKAMASDKNVASDALIARIYAQALGRAPTGAEASVARELVGSAAKEDSIEDLLWVIVMLPEFQVIR
jgi:hypothetical protein